MKTIKVLDLNFKYDDILFEKLNLEIKGRTLNTLVGPNGCGKTTLAYIIAGFIKSNNVYFDDEMVSNSYLKKNVMYVNEFSNIKIRNSHNNEINIIVNSIIQKKYKTNAERNLLNILMAIENKPDLLILDDILNTIENKKEILDIIRNEHITLINITNDIEESLYMDNIIILNEGKIIVNSKTKNVLKKEKLLKENKINLPFMIDLSNKLKFYDLIDEPIIDMDEMVDRLWK